MKTRSMGRDGFESSAIGYGAMSLAGIYGNASEDEAMAVLDACHELGVTHFDTSNVYGNGRSETLIGQWFASRGTAVRDSIRLATKAAITSDPETGKRMFRNDRAHLEGELDKSLKRLGLESVDLFYVHRRDGEIPPEELAGTLKDIIATGKAKSVGLSEIAPWVLRRAATECPIAAVQSEYSLATRAPDLGLIQACQETGAALVAFSPVGRGYLTDTPPTPEYVAASAFMTSNPRFQQPNYTANLAITDGFRALAREMGEPAAGLAIAWCLARGEHVIPIPGTRNVDHMRQLARGAEIELSEGDLATIEAVLPVGWAHGDRYNAGQWVGPERYS